MNKVVFLGFVSLVSGCNGGSSDQFGPECGVNSACPAPELLPAESIIGLWDSSIEIDGMTETIYTDIRETGEFNEYNSQQDNIGTGENCHSMKSGRIWRYTNTSSYQIQFQQEQSTAPIAVTIFRRAEQLSVTIDAGPEMSWARVTEFVAGDIVSCQ